MVTYASSKLPMPKSWDEFEDIVCDVTKIKWRNPNVIRYGRTGQRQNGVDIVGEPYYLYNELGGIQCKNLSSKIDINMISQEIKKAELFEPKLKEFIFACTEKRDSHLQSEIMKLSKERKKEEKFSVLIWFWEDIELEIAGSKELMEKHYPQFLNSSVSHKKVLKMIMDSDVSDWEYDDEEGIFTYKNDVNLTMRRLDTDFSDTYYEPWLKKFPDKNGYRVIYNIFYGNSFIKKEYLVGVDGFRGYIPFPRDGYSGNPKLTKWEYKVGKIIHSKAGFSGPIYYYDRFLERANISVIDE